VRKKGGAFTRKGKGQKKSPGERAPIFMNKDKNSRGGEKPGKKGEKKHRKKVGETARKKRLAGADKKTFQEGRRSKKRGP